MSTLGPAKPKRKKTGGRKPGTPNKIPTLLRDDILEAAKQAHPDGRVAYLAKQANENPVAFMGLLGRVLPLQVAGTDDKGDVAPVTITIEAG